MDRKFKILFVGVILTLILEIMFYVYLFYDTFINNLGFSVAISFINLFVAYVYFQNAFLWEKSIFKYHLFEVVVFLLMISLLISFKIYYIVIKGIDSLIITSLILDLGISANIIKPLFYIKQE